MGYRGPTLFSSEFGDNDPRPSRPLGWRAVYSLGVRCSARAARQPASLLVRFAANTLVSRIAPRRHVSVRI